MVKELVRILGISLILSGVSLYFYTSPKGDSEFQAERDTLSAEVAQLQTQLEETEKELAHLQTLTSEANNRQEDVEEETEQTEEAKDEDHAPDSEAAVATLTLTIESGTTSKDVAQMLEEAHIIEDAKPFNDYLKDKGLTKGIQVGKHPVDASMSIETISKIITTRPNDE